MSGSVNKVILVGNLGADPEIKSFQNGGRIATSVSRPARTGPTGPAARSASAPNGTMSSSTAMAWSASPSAICARARRSISKARCAHRKWQDQNGQDRYTTEVVLSGPGAVMTMLDSAGGGEGGGARRSEGWGSGSDDAGGGFGGGRPSGGAARPAAGGGRVFDDNLDDDEIPF